MHYLSVENLSKSYGIVPLFKDVTFHISQGNKIALVARNGTGKSTLLNIINELEIPDSGKVWVHKDVKLAYLPQNPKFDYTKSAIDNIFNHTHPILQLIKQYELAIANEASEHELAPLLTQIDNNNAWNFENMVHQIISKLQINFLNQKLDTLSGGQLKRIALARTLIDVSSDEQHCLLIMDEPTNHLDFEMIEWLEHYLKSNDITLLLVTHDRYFLDSVCNTIIEIENSIVYRHDGNYNYYLEKKYQRETLQSAELDKAKNIYRRELEWIRKQPKARTTKSKSRIDAFENVKEKATQRKKQLEIELQVKMTRIGGKTIEIKKLCKSYGEKLLFKNFEYSFKRKERVGIVGPNGAGKSTFLNIIQQLDEPDSGKVNVGETVVFGYYNQKGLVLKEDKRVIEYVKSIAEFFPLADGTKLSAALFLERFLFEPDKHYTYISNLSGGEKRRLHLISLLYNNPNFLILDEPTNDLDLPTLQVLEEFLLNFEGCIIIVSHDRYFMDKLVDHLFVFDGSGNITDFPGNYTEYRNYNEDVKVDLDETALDIEPEIKSNQKVKSVNQLSYKEKRELEQIEADLPKLNDSKQAIELQLSTLTDFSELEKLSKKLGEISNEIETKEMRWLELSEKI